MHACDMQTTPKKTNETAAVQRVMARPSPARGSRYRPNSGGPNLFTSHFHQPVCFGAHLLTPFSLVWHPMRRGAHANSAASTQHHSVEALDAPLEMPTDFFDNMLF